MNPTHLRRRGRSSVQLEPRRVKDTATLRSAIRSAIKEGADSILQLVSDPS
jgi:hypothetical protein